MRRTGLIVALAAASCLGGRPTAAAPPARAADIQLANTLDAVSARVKKGATLGTLLEAGHVADADATALVQRARAVFDVRKIKAQQPYLIEQWPGGVLK